MAHSDGRDVRRTSLDLRWPAIVSAATLASVGMLAAPRAEAGRSKATAAHVSIRPVTRGVVVRLAGHRSPVVVAVDGRRVGTISGAPYALVVRGVVPSRGPRRARLTVRETRTGKLLRRVAVRRLAAKGTPATKQPAGPGIVAPPARPASYAVPSGAVQVSTSAGLVAALNGSTPKDIVLADGVYDHPAPFVNPAGHRIYAGRAGGAVLRAGLVLGGNWGPGGGLARGLAFNVVDPAKTLHGAIIHVWGTGRRSQVLDVTLDGSGVVSAGIMVRQPEGFVGRRIVARRFLDWGVIVDANARDLALPAPVLLEDVEATDVSRARPTSSNGTSEACVWIGNTAVVRRVKTRRCAWEGIWAGTSAHGSLFEHLDIDESGIGVYVEHFVRGATFQHMRIGADVRTGLNCEWADPAWGSLPACVDNVVQDSLFLTRLAGVYLDAGTTRTTVRRSTFRGQRWAAIGDYRGVANLADTHGNDYSGLAAGAVPISREHIYSSGVR